jgi:hypothetical protein
LTPDPYQPNSDKKLKKLDYEKEIDPTNKTDFDALRAKRLVGFFATHLP